MTDIFSIFRKIFDKVCKKMKLTKLLMITGNKGKVKEFKELLNIKKLRIDYQSLELPEIQSMKIEQVGEYKTKSALNYHAEIAGYDAVLTDDTALTCEALNGLPGTLIKWFIDCIGIDGLINLLKAKSTDTIATCLLSLGIIKTGEVLLFRGDISGKLVPAMGKNGFGWDRIFLPNDQKVTFGEMDICKKNLISHRAIAAKKLRCWLIN